MSKTNTNVATNNVATNTNVATNNVATNSYAAVKSVCILVSLPRQPPFLDPNHLTPGLEAGHVGVIFDSLLLRRFLFWDRGHLLAESLGSPLLTG